MKTIIKDDKIIVFLNKCETNEIDFNIEEESEEYFKNLFLILNKKYDIKLNGYYNIDIYKDDNYGIILEILEEELDYYNYFDQVDMKINFNNSVFLYETKFEFLDNIISKDIICYKYLDKIYLKIDKLNDLDYFKLLEFSNVIYDDSVKEILKYSKKVNL